MMKLDAWCITCSIFVLAGLACALKDGECIDRNVAVDEADFSALDMARKLDDAPVANATSGGQDEGIEWWIEHDSLLHEAWREWASDGVSSDASLPTLDEDSIIHPSLRNAVSAAWADPTAAAEVELKALWKPIVPDAVFHCPQFLSPAAIIDLRHHLRAASTSGIPVRRPNGMNRYGLLLHPDIPGGVTYPALDSFVFETLVGRYIRPIGRMMFPRFIGKSRPLGKHENGPFGSSATDDGEYIYDDQEAYAFTIGYERSGDWKLNEHSDASAVTININLNMQNETGFEGSSLYFVGDGDDDDDDQNSERRKVEFDFAPGAAVIHRGIVRHAALPLMSGERHQIIIWLFGDGGYVRVAPYEPREQLSIRERWTPIIKR